MQRVFTYVSSVNFPSDWTFHWPDGSGASREELESILAGKPGSEELLERSKTSAFEIRVDGKRVGQLNVRGVVAALPEPRDTFHYPDGSRVIGVPPAPETKAELNGRWNPGLLFERFRAR
jgi:hypothetical protein